MRRVHNLSSKRSEDRIPPDDDGLSAVAHVLVAANHANGRTIEYAEVYARLDALRTLEASTAATTATSAPRKVNAKGYTASYEARAGKIVIRNRHSEILTVCDTWLQAEAELQTL